MKYFSNLIETLTMEIVLGGILLYGVISGVGSCVITALPQTDVCRADVACEKTTEGLNLIQDKWACIKRLRPDYYYYGNNDKFIYDTNYQINLSVENVDISVSEDPLIGTEHKTKNIVNLNINKGNLISLPTQIYDLKMLKELNVVYNKLEEINLIKLSLISTLEVLNCSHNSISVINNQQNEIEMWTTSINKIDLSYNVLEYIPDNCFVKFNHLRYLDLSHNGLLKFDILTFEGMTHLEILFLSYNRLTEIGQNFARFINLKKFALDHNYLTSLAEKELKKLISIENLNISSNHLKNIEDHTFSALKDLQELDLSYNEITSIHKELFANNSKLSNLLLSNNNIEDIEGGSFSNKNISSFEVHNNNLNLAIEKDTFKGIFVKSLNLSGGKISRLGDKAFSSIGKSLLLLNLSRNNIDTISRSSFHSLEYLLELDLSNNKLNDIQFDTSDLKSLIEYNLKNNKLKKIENTMLKNLYKLEKLDLSENSIIEIESSTFLQLNSLENLLLHGNSLNSLKANTFDGLSSLIELDFSYSNIVRFKNELFSGVSFTTLNSSHSDIEVIEYESFKGASDIKCIDLSFNMLEQFHVNTSHLSGLTKLYLNNNKLKYITNSTFNNMSALEKLYLSHNNIIDVNSNAFQFLQQLKILNLHNNYMLRLGGHVIDNLMLSEASLSNIQGNIQFADALNVSIKILYMAHCNISDINRVFVYNIQNTLQLDLSFNNITMLNKGSLGEMPLLNWLDLSFNRISFIQPGTFLSTKMINTLNLEHNNLVSLQYGVLDGLSNLNNLNLRNNVIHVFDAKLLHSTPELSYLYLDDNIITEIYIDYFLTTNLQLLSIGGNLVSCNDLIKIKTLNNNLSIPRSDGNLIITADHFVYNMENVQGITCKTDNVNAFNKNMTNISELTTAIKELHDYFNISKLMLENVDEIKMELVKYAVILKEFVNNSNIPYDKFLKIFSDVQEKKINESNDRSVDIRDTLKSITSVLKLSSDYTLLTNKYLEEQNILLNKTTDTVYDKRDFASQTYNNESAKDMNELDMKVFYVIIACLLVLIVINCVSLFLKYMFKRNNIDSMQNQMCRSNDCGIEMI